MARVTNGMITYDDANYMIANEGFTLIGTSSAGFACLSRSEIETYMNANSLNFSSYASNRLVPYNLLVPISDRIQYVINMTTSDFHWNNDGTEVFVGGTVDGSNTTIIKYTLNTGWELSSLSAVTEYVVNIGNYIMGLAFNPSGTTLYLTNGVTNQIYVYTLSTAWNLNTVGTPTIYSVPGTISRLRGLIFNTTGTHLLMLDENRLELLTFTLSTAWNIATLSTNTVLSTTPITTLPKGIGISDDGKYIFLQNTTGTMYRYTLGTTWNFTSLTYSGIEFNLSPESAMSSIKKVSLEKILTVDQGTPSALYQYLITDTTPPSQVTGLTTEVVTANTIIITWNAATDNIGVTGYRVEWSLNGTTWNLGTADNGITLTWQHSGLNATTLYYYRVRAFDAAGNDGAWSATHSQQTTSALTAILGGGPLPSRIRCEYQTLGTTYYFTGPSPIQIGASVYTDAAGTIPVIDGSYQMAASPPFCTMSGGIFTGNYTCL